MIARAGKPVAKLVALTQGARRAPGLLDGKFKIPDDQQALPASVLRAFGAANSTLLVDTHLLLWAAAAAADCRARRER